MLLGQGWNLIQFFQAREYEDYQLQKCQKYKSTNCWLDSQQQQPGKNNEWVTFILLQISKSQRHMFVLWDNILAAGCAKEGKKNLLGLPIKATAKCTYLGFFVITSTWRLQSGEYCSDGPQIYNYIWMMGSCHLTVSTVCCPRLWLVSKPFCFLSALSVSVSSPSCTASPIHSSTAFATPPLPVPSDISSPLKVTIV